jgi:hypothetical protein
MLFLIPPSLVTPKRSGKPRQFALARKWESWGVKIWDGTSSLTRSIYPSNPLEHRVLQFDSCRGLEGWIVVCLWMDDFVAFKKDSFKDEKIEIEKALQQGVAYQQRLDMKTFDEKQKEYVNLWSMIPFTRAIDTLVITVKDSRSDFASTLKSVAEEYEDFVEWND